MSKLLKLLKLLGIVHSVQNKGRVVKLGRGFKEAHRLNPYNPLSYLFIVSAFLVGLIMFGVVGFWKEIDIKNPFKWD